MTHVYRRLTGVAAALGAEQIAALVELAAALDASEEADWMMDALGASSAVSKAVTRCGELTRVAAADGLLPALSDPVAVWDLEYWMPGNHLREVLLTERDAWAYLARHVRAHWANTARDEQVPDSAPADDAAAVALYYGAEPGSGPCGRAEGYRLDPALLAVGPAVPDPALIDRALCAVGGAAARPCAARLLTALTRYALPVLVTAAGPQDGDSVLHVTVPHAGGSLRVYPREEYWPRADETPVTAWAAYYYGPDGIDLPVFTDPQDATGDPALVAQWVAQFVRTHRADALPDAPGFIHLLEVTSPHVDTGEGLDEHQIYLEAFGSQPAARADLAAVARSQWEELLTKDGEPAPEDDRALIAMVDDAEGMNYRITRLRIL